MQTNRFTTAAQGRTGTALTRHCPSATLRVVNMSNMLTSGRRSAYRPAASDAEEIRREIRTAVPTVGTLPPPPREFCLCGAQLRKGRKVCRKCRDRDRWMRRDAHRTARRHDAGRVSD
jgi:hypothetical protein